jgi:diaminopimelate decarboxylase
MRMGGGPQQIGVDAEQGADLLAYLAEASVDLIGFHVFGGFQNLQAEILSEAQRQTVDLVIDLAQHCRQPVRYVNLGGGFGIPYFEKDVPLDLAAVADNPAGLVARPFARELPQARPVIELGRFRVVGECGVYVTRVVDRKVSRGQPYLVVDGGLHHQLADKVLLSRATCLSYPRVPAR